MYAAAGRAGAGQPGSGALTAGRGAAPQSSMDAPRRDMELLSNSLAAYAHIRANPESFGLYFVLGVCFGLLLTLCLLVISISWAPRPRPRGPAQRRDPRSSTLEPEDDDEDEEDTVTRLGPDDTLPGPELSAEPDGPLSVNVFTSAEELERRSGWRSVRGSCGRSGAPGSRTCWAQARWGPAPRPRAQAPWAACTITDGPRLPLQGARGTGPAREPRPAPDLRTASAPTVPRCYWAWTASPCEAPFPSPARRPQGRGGGRMQGSHSLSGGDEEVK